MEYRFGSDWGGQFARIFSLVAVIITTIGMLAYIIKALGIFTSMFFPYSPETCALFMIVIATIYTMISGFYGVVYTDLFQSVILFTMIILISVMAYSKIGGSENLSAIAEKLQAMTSGRVLF